MQFSFEMLVKVTQTFCLCRKSQGKILLWRDSQGKKHWGLSSQTSAYSLNNQPIYAVPRALICFHCASLRVSLSQSGLDVPVCVCVPKNTNSNILPDHTRKVSWTALGTVDVLCTTRTPSRCVTKVFGGFPGYHFF